MSASTIFDVPTWPTVAVCDDGARYPVRRVFCVGRNYDAHAREMGQQVDREAPWYFTKSLTALVASGTTVPYPPQTSNYHHEIELVVAVGAALFCATPDEALAAVFGYACGLDMTRRDLQLQSRDRGRPWDIGKDVEQSAVISPLVRARGSLALPPQGRIELRVNGSLRQAANLHQMVWGVADMLAHLSRFYHLQAGDLLYTGTPEGVGPVVPGDLVEGSIEGVGDISLRIAPPVERS